MERDPRGARRDQFGHRVADARTELEAVPAEAEGVEQARRRARWTHDRQHVGEIAFAARPGADHRDFLQGRQQLPERAKLRRQPRRIGPGMAGIEIDIDPFGRAAEDDVAALDLPEIGVGSVSAGPDADDRQDAMGQGLGDPHLRPARGEGNRLAELRGDLHAPGAGGVEQLPGLEHALRCRDTEAGFCPVDAADLAVLDDLRTEPPRRIGEGRRDQARIAGAVMRGKGSRDRSGAETGKARADLVGTELLQLEPPGPGGIGIGAHVHERVFLED